MKLFVVVAALLQIGLCGHVAVRMPYLNPAGVTYVNNIPEEAQFPYGAGYGAGYSTAYGTAYGAAYQAQQQYAAPLQYASQLQYAQAAIPAKLEAHHVGYAAAQVPAVAAVPFVKHVPTVSHVPVTRIEAQPAVFEKQVDVLKPAVSTRKVEVRRPGIQKQFYDIEERVIIRPAGSAVVELDEPTSKSQKGPALIQPLHAPFHVPAIPQPVSPNHLFVPSSTPIPAIGSSTVSPNPEEESVVVDNPDFRKINSQQNDQQLFTTVTLPQTRTQPQVFTHSNGVPVEESRRFIAQDPSPSLIPSQRLNPEENKSNQNRLIELLTARGAVSEVGFGREADSNVQIGDAGHVRARVLSATPAPDNVEPTGERVSTRRVVVSRPIETLQEVDVVEPATKLERVSIQQPTLIKTARLDHVQVHGSVPVIGKALTPTVAHAAVPLYQKTISPAYPYYH